MIVLLPFAAPTGFFVAWATAPELALNGVLGAACAPVLAFLEGIGPAEMILVAVLSLLLFGGKGLPEMARTVGKVVREFKKASSSVEEEVKRAMSEETPPPPAKRRPVPLASSSIYPAPPPAALAPPPAPGLPALEVKPLLPPSPPPAPPPPPPSPPPPPAAAP